MSATRARLLAILVAALVFRLLLLSLVRNPGLHDPVHYYNLGRRIAQGQGFTIDYVWHYSRLPDEVTHPIDHWMPLTGVAAAVGIGIGGENAQAALAVFITAGILLPLVTFAWSRHLNQSDNAALIAAAVAAFLPDLVWNSLRTDTTILAAVFVGLAILHFNHGLRSGSGSDLVLTGAFAGLAYLTRNDALLALPVFAVSIALRSRFALSSTPQSFRSFLIVSIAFVVVVAPWLIRNQRELGMLGSAETSRMFYMVEHHDHYAYGVPITLESMLQRQTVPELLGKRLFELAAAFKQIAVSMTIPLLVLAAFGLGRLIQRREIDMLITLSPPLIWLLGILVAYPIFLPLKSQAGSFEKALLTILPLFLPLAVMGLQAIVRQSLRFWIATWALSLLLVYSSFQFVRDETDKADRYYDSIGVVVDALQELPDRTGDDKLRVMVQDPYVFSVAGFESVMIPLASREGTLELAQRYQIDYLMMPPGRPALDPLYLGGEVDDRFRLVAHLDEAGEIPFELYQFEQP